MHCLQIGRIKIACLAVMLLNSTLFSNELKFGVKGGLNLSTWYGAEEEEWTDGIFVWEEDPYEHRILKPGIDIGLLLEMNINQIFYIQPEFLFCSKGFTTEYEEHRLGVIHRNSIILNYLELPILFKLCPFNQVSGVRPSLYAGPALGFRVGLDGYFETEYDDHDPRREMYSDREIELLKDQYSEIDFGIALGGGLGLRMGKGELLFDFRYTLGITKVTKLSESEKRAGYEEQDLPAHKNSSLAFMVGYAIPI